jgi:hypothetical protein
MLLHRFPFSIIYYLEADLILVIAIALRIPAHRGHSFRRIVSTHSGSS